MVRPRNPQGQSEPGIPTRIAEGTPQYVGSDYSFTLQAVMEMQKTQGQLVEAVQALQGAQKETTTKVDGIATKIHTAQTVLWLVGVGVVAIISLVGWIITSAISMLPSILGNAKP
jgi:hypothetical protein